MLTEVRQVWDYDRWITDTVQWWDREDFRGRVTKHITFEKLGGPETLVGVYPIPDSLIICDFCNEDIEDFPCIVWHGYALCPKCRQKIKVEPPVEIEDGRRETC